MGDNEQGQLGDGTTYNSYSPEPIVASNVTTIAAGAAHSLFLKTDGSLWAMGFNTDGELGDGTYNNANLPEQIVAGNVTAVAAGCGAASQSLFLKSDGSLWVMGNNQYGQLGDGTYNNTNRPEQILSANVTAVAAGQWHSLFLKSDGSLWAMGYNYFGQLGDGNFNIGTSLPEQIVASNVTAIAAGGYHSLFLKSDGSLWAMGRNLEGELGDGTDNADRPKQIVASNVTAIAAGEFHSLFLKSDGSLWVMGYNPDGELGDGTTNNVNLPEQIVAAPVLSMPVLGIGAYGSQPVIFFPSVATSINYWLLMTTNLASGNWVTVTNGIPFSGLEITDAPSPVFFRLY
jgi:alpha-tubulin suppressor-like RCC1 family protein